MCVRECVCVYVGGGWGDMGVDADVIFISMYVNFIISLRIVLASGSDTHHYHHHHHVVT